MYGYLAETSWFDGPAAIWCTWGDQAPAHELRFFNNTVVQDFCHNGPWPGSNYECESNFTLGMPCGGGSVPGASLLADNVYYLPLASPNETVYECNMPLAEYQASCDSCDPRSVALPFPEDAVIFAAARAALGMAPALS